MTSGAGQASAGHQVAAGRTKHWSIRGHQKEPLPREQLDGWENDQYLWDGISGSNAEETTAEA